MSTSLALLGGEMGIGIVSAITNANYQAKVARNNAAIARANAQAESVASQIEQQRSDVEYAQLRGEQFAAQGASGLDILGASQIATRGTTELTRVMAAEDIRRTGETAIAGRRSEQRKARMTAKQAQKQMGIDIATSIVGGAKSAASAGMIG